MKRLILNKLIAWKQEKNSKPLILKGARQVGKTYLLKQFGEQYFDQCHYFNFEKEPKLGRAFLDTLDPIQILQHLSFHQEKRIDPQHDLIIFDEIQACPQALTSLKYFAEDLPEAKVCAAGSLLGVYLGPVSYPVGKVDHLDMYPMSFLEFLMAVGDELAVEQLTHINKDFHIPTVLHEKLWGRLKEYFITGGLPEVVDIYRANQEDLFTGVQLVRQKQMDLIEDYFADFAKHSGKINAMHINRIWRSVPEQLARSQDGSGKKFKFRDIVPGIDRFSKLADAIDWLESAGLVLKAYMVNSGKLPLKAYVQENAFKLYLFDIGILGALSELSPKTILDYDYGSYKGFFAENFVAQAFAYMESKKLYSWNENTSEVEFLKEVDGQVIPIEIKSGWVTQAKSLRVFSEKYHPPYRVIMSAKNFEKNALTKTLYLPLYLADQMLRFD